MHRSISCRDDGPVDGRCLSMTLDSRKPRRCLGSSLVGATGFELVTPAVSRLLGLFWRAPMNGRFHENPPVGAAFLPLHLLSVVRVVFSPSCARGPETTLGAGRSGLTQSHFKIGWWDHWRVLFLPLEKVGVTADNEVAPVGSCKVNHIVIVRVTGHRRSRSRIRHHICSCGQWS